MKHIIRYPGKRTKVGKQYDRYFDKNGEELFAGDELMCGDGKIRKLYLTEDGGLGTDATNPHWIETGRAYPCEYGIYPLYVEDLEVANKYNN